jgi:endonuclease/exonuclease/phosphatase family metal-dependent hydrolase
MTASPAHRFRLLAPVAVFVCALLVGIWVAQDTRPAGARSGSVQGVASSTSKPATLRVVAFNMRSGRGMDERVDVDRSADTVRGFDLVGLQEVLFTGPASLDELSRRVGLVAVGAPTERRWFRDDFGNALLTRYPATYEVIPLPVTSGRPARNVLVATVDVGGWSVRVIVAHLGRHEDNAAHVRRVRELLLSLPPPAILLGDLNAHAGDGALEELRATPGVTSVLQGRVADHPDRVIWLFARGLSVRDAGVIDKQASDHPAVWAEFALPR